MKSKFKITLPNGKIVEVDSDKDLRSSLYFFRDLMYHSIFKRMNCRGLGTCGTCSLKIKGKVTPLTKIEKWRLDFPPHKKSFEKGLRLACQAKPLSDLVLEKGKGLWGEK